MKKMVAEETTHSDCSGVVSFPLTDISDVVIVPTKFHVPKELESELK
jgi:hypothetical protein